MQNKLNNSIKIYLEQCIKNLRKIVDGKFGTSTNSELLYVIAGKVFIETTHYINISSPINKIRVVNVKNKFRRNCQDGRKVVNPNIFNSGSSVFVHAVIEEDLGAIEVPDLKYPIGVDLNNSA